MNLTSSARLLHGVSFLILLVSGAVVCFFLLVPWTVAGFIHTEPVYIARRRYVSWINKLYFLYAVVLLEHVAGIKLFVHGQTHEFVEDDNVFVISNHRTRIDWMFSAWVYAAALKSYPFLVLVLKDELKQVPFYGWCMQVMMYMFLSRKKDNDLPHMRKCFEYYEQTNAVSTSMFIFPEGTDLHPAAIARSDAFAEEKKLPVLKHVLYPRPAGFQLCLSEARRRSAVLHDITIAYKDFEDGKRTSDLDLVKGTFPSEVHLFVRRIPVSEIPQGDTEEKEWLLRCFSDKEKLLGDFYDSLKSSKRSSTSTASIRESWSPSMTQRWLVTVLRRTTWFSREVIPVLQIACFAYLEYRLFVSWLGWRGVLFCVVFMAIFAAATPVLGGMDQWEMRQTQQVFARRAKD